jgi:hypothetical protein
MDNFEEARTEHKIRPNLETLSNEVLTQIFSHLDQNDLVFCVALVCKRFHEVTKSSQLLKCVRYTSRNKQTDGKIKSLLDMLRIHTHLEKLVFANLEYSRSVLKIIQILGRPHSNLRHLELFGNLECMSHQEWQDWQEAWSYICPKLKVLKFGWLVLDWFYTSDIDDYDYLAPLVNAKYLTTLQLTKIPTSTTLRQMADNYICLRSLACLDCFKDSLENSGMAYFLDKQSETLTSLKISTATEKPLIAISKCQKLEKLCLASLCMSWQDIDMNGLGSLSNLRYLSLKGMKNVDLGDIIKAAKFPHLNEIEFKDMDGLSDNDVSQIARTYGQQVIKFETPILNLFKNRKNTFSGQICYFLLPKTSCYMSRYNFVHLRFFSTFFSDQKMDIY